MEFTRENSMGLTYNIYEEFGDKTRIRFNQKQIIVNISINEVNQCWYNWQIKGMKVQEAFPNFTSSEREFIMTGITETEWNELWKDE